MSLIREPPDSLLAYGDFVHGNCVAILHYEPMGRETLGRSR